MNNKSNHKTISDNGEEYALLIDGDNLPDGLAFYTNNDKFVQVASWKYEKGHTTKPHSHKICSRESNITQEFVLVKKGSVEVTIYNDQNKKIAKEKLKQGSCILIFKGGHEYKILEDGTEVFEVKNGPYPGIEKDKKVINNV